MASAGTRGRRIDDISKGWDVADAYGVLADLDHTEDFLKAIAANDNVAVTTSLLIMSPLVVKQNWAVQYYN